MTWPSRCSSARRPASGRGAGSLTMPVFAICFSSWYISQIHSAVTQVERLVDEREVRNDVAVHRVLEERPVLPGGIVRMQAVDATCARDIERDQHLATPALDPAAAARTRCSRPERGADVSVRKLLHKRPHETHRFEDLVEAHRNARGDIAARVRSRARIELLPGRERIIDAQIARDAACPGRKPGEAHPLGELGVTCPVMMKRS